MVLLGLRMVLVIIVVPDLKKFSLESGACMCMTNPGTGAAAKGVYRLELSTPQADHLTSSPQIRSLATHMASRPE